MAPTPSPNGDYISPFPIEDATEVVVLPTGTDDYDNLQHALDELAGKEGARLTLVGGAYYHRYMLQARDFDGVIEGAGTGQTTLSAGTPSSRMSLLDADDRLLYNPSGWPSQIIFKETPEDGTPINIDVRGIGFQASRRRGYIGVVDGEDELNLQLRAHIGVFPSYAQLSVIDEALELTGTTPVALPSSGLDGIFIQVWSEVNAGGDNFVEDTDFTFDRTAGTIARIALGAIGDGQTVYATYNDAPNRANVSRADAVIEDCAFRGFPFVDRNGRTHHSVDAAIMINGGTEYGIEQSEYDVFHNGVITEIEEYAALKYSNEGSFNFVENVYTPALPINGTFRVQNCQFDEVGRAVWADHIEGVAAEGSYVFAENAAVRSSLTCRGNRAVRNRFSVFFADTTSATDYLFEDNTVVDSPSIIDTGAGQRYGSENEVSQRLSDWVGITNTWLIRNNRGLLSEQGFFEVGLRIFWTHQFGISDLAPSEEASIVVENNYVELIKRNERTIEPDVPLVGARVRGLIGVIFRDNTFINYEPNEEAILVQDAEHCVFENNDFSRWQKRPAIADIQLSDTTVECEIIGRSALDSVLDEGTDSVITRGTALA